MRIEIAHNAYYHLSLEKVGNDVLFVHVDIYKWSKQLYKEYLSIWVDVLDEMRASGVRRIYAEVPAADDKKCRFCSLFGWNIHSYLQDENGREIILMELEV